MKKFKMSMLISGAVILALAFSISVSAQQTLSLSDAEIASIAVTANQNDKARLIRAKTMLRKEVEKSYSADEIFEFNLIYCDAMVEKVMKAIKKPAL
ncbi:MAG: hypothetical protein PHX54_14205 [Lentimicrobiaceae bacterium]|nr:hypothetical protein [Lentimicrobiaceae bacterium]